jgi:hypothetical protein
MNPFKACGMAMARGLGLGTGWGLGIAIAMMVLQVLAPHLSTSAAQLRHEIEQYLKRAPAEPPASPAPTQPPAAPKTATPSEPTLQDVLDACLGKTS